MGITRQVKVAQNGKEGLEIVEQYFKEQGNYPQQILLDINMPLVDGVVRRRGSIFRGL